MELREVSINGSKQWLHIAGNLSNPLVLVIHGGPGNSLMPWIHEYDLLLREDFLVVNWDQRNSGKSFVQDFNIDTLNFKQFQEDLVTVVNLLNQEYSRPVNLLGHSWGSLLALSSLSYLDNIASYIGVGQLVDITKSQELGLKFLKGNIQTEELESLGSPPFDLKTIQRYGQYIMENKGVLGEFSHSEMIRVAMKSPNVSLNELESFEQGSNVLFECLSSTINNFNAFDFKKIDIPVAIFHGENDITTNFSLAHEFFLSIEAPFKKFYKFKNCAHFPMWECPRLYRESLRDFLSSSF